MEKCSVCNSNNIQGIEWLGSYDGILARECLNCGKLSHVSTGYEIVGWIQPEQYGKVYFILKHDGVLYRYINKYSYHGKFTEKDEKIFEEIEEKITI